MPRMLRSPAALAFVVMLALIVSCKPSAPAGSGTDAAPAAAVRTLRVSMIPSTDPTKLLRDSEQLTAYLERSTGAKVALTVPLNYASVVEALVSEKVDIAYLGGFTFVQASQRAQAVPLVQRDRDQNFHSVFITQADAKLVDLKGLAGHSFAFGDVNSTSGHLMPEYFMRQANVPADLISKAFYTGGHDATALAVANRKADAGAMDEVVYDKMMKEGTLDSSKVKVFWKSPPFFDYVWAARKGLDPQLSAAFAAAFLKLDPADAESKKLLELMSAARFVKAEDASYEPLRQAARQAGLLR